VALAARPDLSAGGSAMSAWARLGAPAVACASGPNAIGNAFHAIKHGHSRRVLAGGYDALAELVFAGFDSLQALSTTRPRPFAADRDGLALGEGAGVFTLERLEDAQARGATILAEIIGYGATTDLHHLTQPHPEGIAAARSMTMACKEAMVTPDQIDYINLHGTATLTNDAAEDKAVFGIFGDRVPASSTKGATGHTLGAAGAIEAIICALALTHGLMPGGGINSVEADPVLRTRYLIDNLHAPLRYALSNSFGFGGTNCALAFGVA